MHCFASYLFLTLSLQIMRFGSLGRECYRAHNTWWASFSIIHLHWELQNVTDMADICLGKIWVDEICSVKILKFCNSAFVFVFIFVFVFVFVLIFVFVFYLCSYLYLNLCSYLNVTNISRWVFPQTAHCHLQPLGRWHLRCSGR